MELWFIYAVASALFAGLHAFALKIAATHNHNGDANTALSALVSAGFGWIIIIALGWWQAAWELLVMFALLSGVLYSFGAAARVNSLKYIDTTIFFPLYKTIGPIIAVVAGLLIFSETLNAYEIFGVALSLAVPLLLLHKDERTRQKALAHGLLLLALSVTLIMTAQIANKYATGVVGNILLFATVTHTFTFFLSILLWYKHTKKNGAVFAHSITKDLISISVFSGIFQFLGFYAFLKAFELGTLSIVFTINSLYIVIPIVLSVWWYKEHFNLRKGAAVVLSILALAFLR